MSASSGIRYLLRELSVAVLCGPANERSPSGWARDSSARCWSATIYAMVEDTFPIRFGLWKPLLVVLGMGPSRSRVEIDRTTVRVRMGWAFRAKIGRASIGSAFADSNKYGGIGVHGWRGSWLVNGSVSGIVTIAIDPPAPARVMGFPIRLRTLYVSLEDPDGFLVRLAE